MSESTIGTRRARAGSRVGLWLLALAAVAGVAAANSFKIPLWTADGGGGQSTGGTFLLRGTIGQPDAATALTGGPFILQGGFWYAARNLNGRMIFGDGFEKGDVSAWSSAALLSSAGPSD